MERVVVLIDDDPDDTTLLQDSISDLQPKKICIHFDNPVRAVKELSLLTSKFIVEYVFIDFNMPMMNGEECLLKLRELPELHQAKFIVSSTGMTTTLAERLKQKGADCAFQKPNSMRGYLSILSSIMDAGETVSPTSPYCK